MEGEKEREAKESGGHREKHIQSVGGNLETAANRQKERDRETERQRE